MNIFAFIDGYNVTIYKNGQFGRKFKQTEFYSKQSCTPTPSLAEDNNIAVLELQNQDIFALVVGFEYNQTKNSYLQDIDFRPEDGSFQIDSKKSKKFTLTHGCKPPPYLEDDVWTIVNLNISNSKNEVITIKYQFSCDSSYRFFKFDLSLFCLLLLSTALLYIFSTFGIIYSFQSITFKGDKQIYFQGFTIKSYYVLVYVFLMLIFGYFAIVNPTVTELQIPQILLIIFGAIIALFFIDEVLCRLPILLKLQYKLFFKLRLCDILAFLITFGLILGYWITEKAWYLNDIISFCFIGGFIKLFKICSMKVSTIVLMSCMILDCAAGTLIHYTKEQSYDQLVQKNFNYPVELQIPLFTSIYEKKCAWISVFNVILPGLVLSYLIRFDLSKKRKLYSAIGFTLMLIGQIIYVAVQSVNKHTWPQSIFTYPILIFPILLLAFKRQEFILIWNGKFYDSIYCDPFQRTRSQMDTEYQNVGVMIQTRRGVTYDNRLLDGIEDQQRHM
ncbi:hypothetical protein pb186bvf_001710 [Paramecium bursaria]